MATNNNTYSINYTKYHIYNDPFYYYCDKTSVVDELDPKNEFIEYIKKTKNLLTEHTKKYLATTVKSFIDCESSNFNLKSLIKSHSFKVIWNPKIYYLNFHTSTFFLQKDEDDNGKYSICILTSKKTEDKKFYIFLAKFYYFALKQDVNEKLNNVVYFIPVSQNYLEESNWFNYSINENSDYEYINEQLCSIYKFINYEVERCKVGVDIFPNMKNTYDYPYHNYKQKVASEIDEITQYYYCSVKEREFYLSNNNGNVYSSSTFGIKNKTDKSKKIDGILKYRNNTNTSPFKIYGNKEKLYKTLNELFNHKNLCFIDFEVVNGLLDISKELSSFPKLKFHNCIFNIGLLVYNVATNKKVFYSFFLEQGFAGEAQMINDFFECIDELDDPLLIHWSNAELSFLNSFGNRTKDAIDFGSYNYFDLHYIFNKYNIIVKGMKSFKLKDLINNLNGFDEELTFEKYLKLYKKCNNISIINNTELNVSTVQNGLETIGIYLNQNLSNAQIIDIATYNFNDCYYLYVILTALFANFN